MSVRRLSRISLFTCLLPVSVTGSAEAQVDTPTRARDLTIAIRTLTVRPLKEPVPVGALLSERLWDSADSIVDFRQREPAEGVPASERTVVKVARDANALYIAVRAFDLRPAETRATQLRRDADMSSDDNVTVLIDSFHDRRSAFVFQTNPNGAMWDAQFSGVDNLNPNWNGIWEIAVSRDSSGWAAVFRIPFSTLRFDAGAGTSFGFNVRRFIRRKNEEVLWQGWERAHGLYHLRAEGDLIGLGVLPREHNMAVVPYLLARAIASEHDSAGNRLNHGFLGAKSGADAKLALTPTLTGDLTVNTDFAQVETDRQVINLTRFPLFFPEKREFFVESSGVFAFGTESRAQLFYSRRIGLDTLGEQVPILGGVRLTGRAGSWTLGMLDARTGANDQANDAVVRVKHDILERSYIGGMFLDHSGPGVRSGQRSGGLDIDLPLVVRGYNIEPSFWIAGTQTPRGRGIPIAWRYGTDFPNDLFDTFVSLYRGDSGYAPPLGFVRRTGIWETTGHIDYMPRPGVLGIRQLDIVLPLPSWDIIADETSSPRTLADSRTWLNALFEWRLFGGSFQSGDLFEVNLQRVMDVPTEAFEIFPGVTVPAGRYWWTRHELQYQTSVGRPFSFGAFVNWGDFYAGRSTDISASVTWLSGGHMILGSDLSRVDAHLTSGHFVATQSAGRLEYTFNTRTDFLAFVQLNNEVRRADFNLRFHWIPQIGDDVYLVWNSGYTTDPSVPRRFPSGRVLAKPLNGALVLKAVHRIAP